MTTCVLLSLRAACLAWARNCDRVGYNNAKQAEYHEEFRNLFEQEMAVFLRQEGCSQADFAAVLTRAFAERAPQAESESCMKLTNRLLRRVRRERWLSSINLGTTKNMFLGRVLVPLNLCEDASVFTIRTVV